MSKPNLDRTSRRIAEAEHKANLSTADQYDRFGSHRSALMSQLLEGVDAVDEPSLCVLGAGNCNDLDLPELTKHYTHITLVDLDEQAVEKARRRHAKRVRDRITCCAPVDITNLLEALPRWNRLEITPEELMAQPLEATRSVVAQVGQDFDRVLSACVLTQLQLTVLRQLGADHRLFQVVTRTVHLGHLRILHALTRPGGRALLATELVSNETAPLAALDGAKDLLPALQEYAQGGNVIGVAHPDRLLAIAKDDPILSREARVLAPHAAWLWHQGPKRSYLAYGLWLENTTGACRKS